MRMALLSKNKLKFMDGTIQVPNIQLSQLGRDAILWLTLGFIEQLLLQLLKALLGLIMLWMFGMILRKGFHKEMLLELQIYKVKSTLFIKIHKISQTILHSLRSYGMN